MLNVPQTRAALWPRGEVCPFDDILDVRSPAEFALDHLPHAVNLPVLDDAERAQVGTIYRASAFEARKIGAALVSANIGRHLAGHFALKDKDYKPFVYCWRGGHRSGSLATVLASVGWRVAVLAGGYKTYRAHVCRELDAVPPLFAYRVLAGATGTGKTRLLHALAARGAQTLDLEALANHRGSLLGDLGPQPSQKAFESRLLDAFQPLDVRRPVWLEAESNRIGNLYLPPVLWACMRAASGVELRVPLAGRVQLLRREYAHLVADAEGLKLRLRPLAARHGLRQVDAWFAMIDAGAWDEFVASLLATHYDPGYAVSARRCFPGVTQVHELPDASPAALEACASLLARFGAGTEADA